MLPAGVAERHQLSIGSLALTVACGFEFWLLRG
jgi:hypothetical protein